MIRPHYYSMDKNLPRYPVYIVSKGRWDNKGLTARCLIEDSVPFYLVVEPQERDAYASSFGNDHILVLPFRDRGTSVPARNWAWEHSISQGYERHWVLDDNIRGFYRRYKTKRLYCRAGFALSATEDFVDRYENIAIAGLNYYMFVPDRSKVKPFQLNCHVYSCMLIWNDLPYRWRGQYNEDTDLCLQVLAGGWCTVLMNVFQIIKMTTMKMKGGNTDVLYKGDGRLRMARSLERMWPGAVETKRKFRRPQHHVFDSWKRFDTPLRLKEGVNLSELERVDERGIDLKQVKQIKSTYLQELYNDYQENYIHDNE